MWRMKPPDDGATGGSVWGTARRHIRCRVPRVGDEQGGQRPHQVVQPAMIAAIARCNAASRALPPCNIVYP